MTVSLGQTSFLWLLHLYVHYCMQLKDDEERLEDEEAENRKKLKSMREHHKNWEQNRDGRVGTWRTFVDKKSKAKKVTFHCLLSDAVQHG